MALARWRAGHAEPREMWNEAAVREASELERPSYARDQRAERENETQVARFFESSPGNGFEAIDAISLHSCIMSLFDHLENLPDEHLDAWALAISDVLRAWRDAPDASCKERMLTWLLVLHDVLLRLPPRGGRRGRGAVAHRFSCWASGGNTAEMMAARPRCFAPPATLI